MFLLVTIVNLKKRKETYPKILCGIRVGLMPDGMITFHRDMFLCRDRQQQVRRQINLSLNDKSLNILTQVLSYTCPRKADVYC